MQIWFSLQQKQLHLQLNNEPLDTIRSKKLFYLPSEDSAPWSDIIIIIIIGGAVLSP
jgi:hypothetical protein